MTWITAEEYAVVDGSRLFLFDDVDYPDGVGCQMCGHEWDPDEWPVVERDGDQWGGTVVYDCPECGGGKTEMSF